MCTIIVLHDERVARVEPVEDDDRAHGRGAEGVTGRALGPLPLVAPPSVVPLPLATHAARLA
jgi:hypothetical protein